MPLCCISLNDPGLLDQLFVQLVSATGLRHDNAVMQIDEFLETLLRRGCREQSQSAYMEGFCEVTQGSNIFKKNNLWVNPRK